MRMVNFERPPTADFLREHWICREMRAMTPFGDIVATDGQLASEAAGDAHSPGIGQPDNGLGSAGEIERRARRDRELRGGTERVGRACGERAAIDRSGAGESRVVRSQNHCPQAVLDEIAGTRERAGIAHISCQVEGERGARTDRDIAA